MCTALTLKTPDGYHLFGRNMDLEYTFGQHPIVVPRKFEYIDKISGEMKQTKYAIVGMASVVENHPLFAEAVNEKGLGCAGLNFPAAYWEKEAVEGMENMPPYDLIPWITGNFETIDELRPHLDKVNLVGVPFAENLQLPTLHWIVTDLTGKSIVIEKTKEAFKVYDNPVGVMTNAPSFDWHTTNLSQYMNVIPTQPQARNWSDLELKPIGSGTGAIGLPGDFSSPSRFVRVAFLRAKIVIENKENDGIVEFFHILNNVAMVKGGVITADNKNEITQYTSCMCQEKGLYYYKTYDNNQINVVDMNKVDLDSNEIKIFPYNDTQVFNALN